jgi:hypothetical protein
MNFAPCPSKALNVVMAVLALASLPACGKRNASGDSKIDGLGKFQFSMDRGNASLSVVFEDLSIDAGARIPLARPAGAFIELGPDFQSGGTLLVLSVPVSGLLQGGNGLPLFGLPDGRPLPGVRNGVLGAVSVQLPILGYSVLYMSEDAYGVFFPLNLPNLPVMISTRMRDERGNVLGVIYGIPKGSRGSVSGVLFLFPVEGA